MKTPLLFIALLVILNIGCTKDETPIKEEQIEQGEEKGEEETEEVEEETINNPDLELIGGQGAFTITPGSGIMSGDTSVNLRIIFDDFKTQIPNDSLDYKIEWKTNGAFGSFESEVKEAAILDLDGIIYTSTNTATSTGEEKFMATLYSRPKGSSDEFTLNGSAQTNLTISNDPKKKYYIIEDTFYLKKFIDEPCGDNPNSVRNLLINSFFVPKIPGAKSYSLSTNEIVLASRVLDDGSTVFTRYGILNWNWNNNSTQYPNSSAEGTTADGTLINNTAEFELPFIPGALNLCHPDYAEIVAIRGALNGIGYLTVTLE